MAGASIETTLELWASSLREGLRRPWPQSNFSGGQRAVSLGAVSSFDQWHEADGEYLLLVNGTCCILGNPE